MEHEGVKTATELRDEFMEIPEDDRKEYLDFSTRIRRGLGWLGRAEDAEDLEEELIALFIAFSSIHGRVESREYNPKEKTSWQSFLSKLLKLDRYDLVGQIVRQQRSAILHIVYNKFLFQPYWDDDPDWEDKQKRAQNQITIGYRSSYTWSIVMELFERMFLFRSQVFHGAFSSGKKYNRKYFLEAVEVLSALIPAMIEIMIDSGLETDWGEVCYPVQEDDE